MAIQTDQQGKKTLQKIVGSRLKAARRAAGLSMEAAASRLHHKGITQVSLAESGERLPPTLDLMKYADLYVVPVDFLLGRIDDPIAETAEHSHGLMVRAMTHSIGPLFCRLTEALASQTAVGLSGLREDRADLNDVIQIAAEVQPAMERLRQLNPDFDDLRGGSRVQMLIDQIAGIGRRVESRVKSERIQYAMIDKALDVQAADERIQQFAFSFDIRRSEPESLPGLIVENQA